MSGDTPDVVKALCEQMTQCGERFVVATTTDENLPWVVFAVPSLGLLSQYVAQAGDASVGPLQGAVGLARVCVRYPGPEVIASVVATKPFVVMRAVQVLLREMGLSARAEKKSP